MDNEEDKELLENFFGDVELKGNELQDQIQRQQELAKLDVIRFTRSKMKKSEALSSIVEKASKILMDRLGSDPIELAEISTGTLAYIIEKLSKVEVDLLGAMLSANKNSGPSINVNVGKDEASTSSKPKEKEIPISKDQFESAKNVIEFMEKVNKIVQSGEFPEINVEATESTEEKSSDDSSE